MFASAHKGGDGLCGGYEAVVSDLFLCVVYRRCFLYFGCGVGLGFGLVTV